MPDLVLGFIESLASMISTGEMSGRLHIQFEGAIYHVMSGTSADIVPDFRAMATRSILLTLDEDSLLPQPVAIGEGQSVLVDSDDCLGLALDLPLHHGDDPIGRFCRPSGRERHSSENCPDTGQYGFRAWTIDDVLPFKSHVALDLLETRRWPPRKNESTRTRHSRSGSS